MKQRLSLVTLGVADVARARAFYERLGWTASSASNSEIAFFQVGSLGLAFYPQAHVSRDTGIAGEPQPGAVTLACNVASREEVDATLAEVAAAGARLLSPAVEMPWGGYVGYFADLDGHPWEVACVPAFPLSEDGAITLPE